MGSVRKKIVALSLMVAMAVCAAPADVGARASYTPPCDTVRIGIYTYTDSGNIDQKSFPSANLMNVDGKGYGYELGYFEGREFVPVGISVTDTDEITMLKDRSMVYDAGSNSYAEGTEGSVVVGCFHMRLNESFGSGADARARADGLTGGFVKYHNGAYEVLFGQYVSSADAEAAARAFNDAGMDVTVDSGTSYTVSVVQTRTNRILFEFDCGTEKNLGVMPIAPEGEKAQTWFKKCIYYGGFSYLRNSGGNLTVVNYVDVEDYIKGVVPWEMSASWPREALKAQAITARTYLMANIKKHSSEGFDICNTVHCQAYHGTSRANENSDAAVDETAGKYLTYGGELCETYYYASNGGASENSENVWTKRIDYLRGVADPYEKDIVDQALDYRWTRTYTPQSLGERLRSRGYNSSDVVSIDMTFTQMGNVYSIRFTDVNGVSNTVTKGDVRTIIGGNSIRYTLNGTGPVASDWLYVNGGEMLPEGLNGVYATGSGGTELLSGGEVYAITGTGDVEKLGSGGSPEAKNVRANADGKFVFTGTGNGHNVGMSQWGAYSMAYYYGKTCEEILTFYYTGTQIAGAAE